MLDILHRQSQILAVNTVKGFVTAISLWYALINNQTRKMSFLCRNGWCKLLKHLWRCPLVQLMHFCKVLQAGYSHQLRCCVWQETTTAHWLIYPCPHALERVPHTSTPETYLQVVEELNASWLSTVRWDYLHQYWARVCVIMILRMITF